MNRPLFNPCTRCGTMSPYSPLCFECRDEAIRKITYTPADKMGGHIPDRVSLRRDPSIKLADRAGAEDEDEEDEDEGDR